MSWIFFALVIPVLWSLGNVLDQFMSRVAFGHSAFSFLIISGVMTLPAPVIMYFFAPQVLDVSPGVALLLVIGGMIGFAGAWPYLLALQDDDAATAVPILQTVPVFAYLFGFFFLGEGLSLIQIAGGMMVVAGSMAFAWNPHTRKIHTKTLVCMMASAVIWGAYAIWVRKWALDIDWVVVSFWTYVTWTLIGFSGLLFRADFRRDLRAMFMPAVVRLYIPLLAAQQFFAYSADLLQTHTFSFAPTAVQVILFNGLQPVLIMVLCGLFFYWRPDIYEPLKRDRRLFMRLGFLLLTGVGLILLIGEGGKTGP